MEIKEIPLSKIKPYENNPRKNKAAVDAVVESIRQCEYVAPIVVDENGVILAGHTRYKALKKLGHKTAEVCVKSGLTDEQKRKYRLLDNKTNELAEWDFEKLTEELDGLDFGELELDWGIEDADPKQPEAVEDGYSEQPPAEAKSKRGDVYRLGRHRLMCGDSTNAGDVARLMDGAKADILFSSPPYNAGRSKIVTPSWKTQGGGMYADNDDNLTDEEYGKFLCDIVKNGLDVADDVLLNIGVISGSKVGVCEMLYEYRKKLCDILIWDKIQGMPMGLQKAQVAHTCELIFCFNHTGTRSFSHSQWKAGKCDNKITTNKASKNEYAAIHNATFPVEFASEVIQKLSESSAVDLFGGTGTTMIACEQLGRTCYMMELAPRYVDTIIDRWEKFTGEKAVKID